MVRHTFLVLAAVGFVALLGLRADAVWIGGTVENSRQEARREADFVCTGASDEVVVPDGACLILKGEETK